MHVPAQSSTCSESVSPKELHKSTCQSHVIQRTGALTSMTAHALQQERPRLHRTWVNTGGSTEALYCRHNVNKLQIDLVEAIHAEVVRFSNVSTCKQRCRTC
jgi:hypothetical protein